MITKLSTLKDLPYDKYRGCLILKEEDSLDIVKEGEGWIFISKSPKCIFLYIKLDKTTINEDLMVK